MVEVSMVVVRVFSFLCDDGVMREKCCRRVCDDAFWFVMRCKGHCNMHGHQEAVCFV
jgi:hypothetical protein